MGFAIFKARRSGTVLPAKEEEWYINGFKEIWDSGIYITRMDAKHKGAMEALEEDGLRLMTYKEVLTEMSRRPNFKKELEGKIFHIDGEGSIAGSGIFDGRDRITHPDYYKFDEKSELIPGRGDPRKTVQIYRGRSPLSFYVYMDHSVGIQGANFAIFANQSPSQVLSMVVGVKKEATKHSVQTVEDSKIFDSLMRVA